MLTIFNLENFWLLNFAIAVSYCISSMIINQRNLFLSLSQGQRLLFARSLFIGTIIIFLLMPFLVNHFAVLGTSSFQIQPLLHQLSEQMVLQQSKVTSLAVQAQHQISISTHYFVQASLVIGFCWFATKYIHSLFVLKKITRQAFCRHQVSNIHILFHSMSNIPFCWSSFTKHYVLLPESLLEKPADLKLAVRHELQHIRQGDTRWLHFLAILKTLCFINPFIWLWLRKFNELQEYACDEALVLSRSTAVINYAQCLVDLAGDSLKQNYLPQNALGFSKCSYPSILQRRVSMLVNYKATKRKLGLAMTAYIISFLTISSIAFAFSNKPGAPFTQHQVELMIRQAIPKNTLQVSATPEVVAELNNIRSSEKARTYMQTAINNMQSYKPYIQHEFKNNSIPEDLLALPLAESGYRPLNASQNDMQAAGIWQFVPSTAQRYGLVINDQRDDRLDTKLSTTAAINYLNDLYAQFKDWKLAAVAYEIGEANTSNLMNITKSRNPWVLAANPVAPKGLKNYLALLDASVILIHNPSLVQ